MSTVRSHTRHVNGKAVQVRRHTRTDEEIAAADQRKRDAFQRRALAEQQRAASPQAYAGQAKRVPGERRKRRSRALTRAKRHAKKAMRLWRRHKVRAAAYAGLALGEITFHGVRSGAARARSAWRKRRKARNRR